MGSMPDWPGYVVKIIRDELMLFRCVVSVVARPDLPRPEVGFSLTIDAGFTVVVGVVGTGVCTLCCGDSVVT
jgi:hypothetical protein